MIHERGSHRRRPRAADELVLADALQAVGVGPSNRAVHQFVWPTMLSSATTMPDENLGSDKTLLAASSFACRVKDQLGALVGDLRLTPVLDLPLHRLEVALDAVHSNPQRTGQLKLLQGRMEGSMRPCR